MSPELLVAKCVEARRYAQGEWPEWQAELLRIATQVEANGLPYHNLDHLDSMLTALHSVPFGLDEAELAAIEVAIIYHDACYVVGSPLNEKISAQWAIEGLSRLRADGKFIATVFGLIDVTRNHINPNSRAEQVMIDLDLHEIGTDCFAVNSEKIRREFAMFDDAVFNAGRKRFHESYLAHDPLFFTAWGRTLQPVAISNMKAEIEALT